MKPKCNVGGQAVIEGVMMRGPNAIATAVRQPDGEIVVKKDFLHSITERYPLLKWPMLRGVVALIEALIYGLRALSFSAQAAGEEEEQLTNKEIGMTMFVALALAIVLFIVIPTGALRFVKATVTDPIALNVIEGILRLAIFLGYITAISRMKDIQRVFQYHGAEHKVIFTYEAGEDLTVENVRPKSTLHPRCGTNFLMIVMVVSIVVFAFLGWPSLWERIVSRILLMPVVAGIGYEFIRFSGKYYRHPVMGLVAVPGLWLQNLTTRQPDDSQIEVAIRALQEVLPADVVDLNEVKTG